MSEILSGVAVRPLIPADLPELIDIDHSYSTEYVWQMDISNGNNQVEINFREIRLPRAMPVRYPRDPMRMADDWKVHSAVLVAERKDEILGYLCLDLGKAPATAWITDIVVRRHLRRRGVGAKLVLAAQTWAAQQQSDQLLIELQSKNYPGICFTSKLGYEFCGYSDHYYANRDIALFFARRIN